MACESSLWVHCAGEVGKVWVRCGGEMRHSTGSGINYKSPL